MTPARQRSVEFCEWTISLIYMASFNAGLDYIERSVSKIYMKRNSETWTHRSYPRPRSNYLKFPTWMGKASKTQSEAVNSWQLMAVGEMKVTFLAESDHCLLAHSPLDNPIPPPPWKWAALTGLSVILKSWHRVAWSWKGDVLRMNQEGLEGRMGEKRK